MYSWHLSYLTVDGSVDKKGKGAKKCVIRQEIKFQDYKECLEKMKQDWNLRKVSGVMLILYSLRRWTRLYSMQMMRMQTHDGVISYPYRIGPGIVCKEELMKLWKIKNWI